LLISASRRGYTNSTARATGQTHGICASGAAQVCAPVYSTAQGNPGLGPRSSELRNYQVYR